MFTLSSTTLRWFNDVSAILSKNIFQTPCCACMDLHASYQPVMPDLSMLTTSLQISKWQLRLKSMALFVATIYFCFNFDFSKNFRRLSNWNQTLCWKKVNFVTSFTRFVRRIKQFKLNTHNTSKPIVTYIQEQARTHKKLIILKIPYKPCYYQLRLLWQPKDSKTYTHTHTEVVN